MNDSSHTPTNPFRYRMESHAGAVSAPGPRRRRTWRAGLGIVLVVALAAPAILLGPLRGSDDSSAAASTAQVQGEVRRLYLAFFLREPDATGWPFWLNHREQGRSLRWVADRFAESDEFRMRYGNVNDEDFVRLVYRNVLKRDPDPTGWATWTGLLARGGSRGEVMLGFSESEEFRLRTRDGSGGSAVLTPTAPTTTPRPETPKPTPTTVPPPTPTTVPAPTPTTVPAPAPVPGTPPGLPVNQSAIPPAVAGWGDQRIQSASYSPIRQPSDPTGAFRVNCQFSHMNFDDPIVYPGASGAAHLHIYYGNTRAAAASTPESIRTQGNSTCTGGTANRTAYWAPAIIDTATGNPVHPGTDAEARDHALQVYYKSGYEGVVGSTVQNFPDGLRMVAGTATSTSPQPSNIVSYHCANGANGGATQASFPNCRPGQILVMTVAFPQCWDGRNLDSPDHKSHMAYGAGWPDRGCPASHPVPLVQVTQNFRYRVPASGMSTWRLSSDTYSGPAGYSGHADWMNGWDRNVFQSVVDNCIRPGLDCQMNLLGDGRQIH